MCVSRGAFCGSFLLLIGCLALVPGGQSFAERSSGINTVEVHEWWVGSRRIARCILWFVPASDWLLGVGARRAVVCRAFFGDQHRGGA